MKQVAKVNNFVALVSQIPVDQTAKATIDIKKFLVKKVREIKDRRTTIEAAAAAQKREKIIDEYRKAVGFQRLKKTASDLEEKLNESRNKITMLGLDDDGDLLHVPGNLNNKGGATIYHNGRNTEISAEAVGRIKKVHELISAVEGEAETFGLFDQLETRMMMSSNIGEAMAIVNAFTGARIFDVDTAKLGVKNQLEDRK